MHLTLTALLSLLFCLLVPATCIADASSDESILEPHTATYQARIKKGISLNGTAIRKLQQTSSGRWLYQFNVSSLPVDIEESVEFRWQDALVTPKKYRYHLSGMLIRDKTREVKFEWPKQRAKGSDRHGKWKIAIPPGAQDRLSYQLQLMADIARGQTNMTYEIVHKGRIEKSEFRILREETIKTDIGEKQAIVVEKVRAPDRPRKTLLWFSKNKPFLLLKMYQLEKDGEEYEINIQSYQASQKPSQS